MEILGEIAALVEQGKKDAQSNYPRHMKGQPGVHEKVEEALAQGVEPMRILNEGLTPGMRALGKKFADGQIFVPEVLMASKAMNAGVEILRPLLRQGEVRSRGTVVLGTVAGDIHDIGKNLVKLLIEGNGWNVEDLGVNVVLQRFVESVRKTNPVAIGLSALLTTTMESMRDVVGALREAGVETPVVIGGAPVTEGYAREIGAIYGRDPQAALDILDQISASKN